MKISEKLQRYAMAAENSHRNEHGRSREAWGKEADAIENEICSYVAALEHLIIDMVADNEDIDSL